MAAMRWAVALGALAALAAASGVTVDVMPSQDYIRLVPGLRSKQGAVWSQLPVDYDSWSVELKFFITGRGRIGADGLAFWYVRENNQLGGVFGSKNEWDGLGVFFDTYDNDAKNNNPLIGVMLNDGKIKYDADTDGMNQMQGSCIRHIRNPANPTYAKITYRDNTITVSVDVAGKGTAYQVCTEVKDVTLPKGYYFGVSASTGGLADDHDILSFETYQLFDPNSQDAPAIVDEPADAAVQPQGTETGSEQAAAQAVEDDVNMFSSQGGSDAIVVLLNQVIKKQETLADSIQQLEGKLANCAASPATPAGGSAADRAAKATPEGFVPTSPELDELARQIVEATTNRFGQLQTAVHQLRDELNRDIRARGTTNANAGGSHSPDLSAIDSKLNSLLTRVATIETLVPEQNWLGDRVRDELNAAMQAHLGGPSWPTVLGISMLAIVTLGGIGVLVSRLMQGNSKPKKFI